MVVVYFQLKENQLYCTTSGDGKGYLFNRAPQSSLIRLIFTGDGSYQKITSNSGFDMGAQVQMDLNALYLSPSFFPLKPEREDRFRLA